MRNFYCLPIFAILAGTLSFVSPAHAQQQGLTATGNTLPIGAANTTVLTITGGTTPSAAFATNAPVSIPAGISGVLDVPAGLNVTGVGTGSGSAVLYPTGNAYFSGTTIVGGDVGIGTSSPTAALDVTSTLGGTGAIHTYTGDVGNKVASGAENYGGNIWIGGQSDFTFDGGTDSDFWFNNNGTIDGATGFRWNGDLTHAGQFNLYIENSGNIGVGTSNPLATLHVVSPAYNNNATGILVESTSTLDGSPRVGLIDTSLGADTAAPAWFIDNDGDNFRIFRQPTYNIAGKTFVEITNTGNVGVGPSPTGVTWTPAGTLDVENGTNTATFCLNGTCISSMAQLDGKNGAAGAVGPAGPTGPTGATGATGPAGLGVASATTSGNNIVITYTNGATSVLPIPTTVARIVTNVNAINNASLGGPPCGNVGGLQDGVPGTTRTEAEWLNTCGNRACLQLGYHDGRLVEYASTTDVNASATLSCVY